MIEPLDRAHALAEQLRDLNMGELRAIVEQRRKLVYAGGEQSPQLARNVRRDARIVTALDLSKRVVLDAFDFIKADV